MPPESRQSVEQEMNETLCNCADCGEQETPSNTFAYQNANDDDVCDSCSDNYTSCYSCDDTIHIDDAEYGHGDSYCVDCYHENFTDCESCGDTIHSDDTNWSERTEGYVCESCYDEQNYQTPEWEVMSKEYVETRTSFVNPKYDKYERDTFFMIESKRNIGVEIETNFNDDYSFSEISDDLRVQVGKTRDADVDEWFELGKLRMTSDTSTTNHRHPYGGEVVMNPRRGDILVQDVDSVCQTLQQDWGAYASVKTGLHLHIDVQDYDWLHASVLTFFTKMMEPHIYTWLPKSRWYGSGHQRWSRPVSQSVNDFHYVSDRDSFVDFYYDNGGYTHEKYNDKRYHGLNWHCHFQSNQGVEIRYHSGTLQTDKIKHWAIFWTKVVDKCYDIAQEIARNGSPYQFGDTTLYQSLVVKPRIVSKCGRILDKYSDVYVGFDGVQDRHIGMSSDINQYRRDSEMLRRYIGLEKKDSAYQIKPMVDYIRMRHNQAVMSVDNIFDVFDIPTETRDYFMKRKSQLQNAMLPDVASKFYDDVFHNITSVIEYNDKTMMFEYRDIFQQTFPLVKDFGMPIHYRDVNYDMISQYA